MKLIELNGITMEDIKFATEYISITSNPEEAAAIDSQNRLMIEQVWPKILDLKLTDSQYIAFGMRLYKAILESSNIDV
jgi:hypothetical protein